MRKNYIVKTIVVGLLFFFCISCKEKAASTSHKVATAKPEYTCPMHSHVISDKPGKCPVCNMDLVPRDLNKEMHIDSSMNASMKSVNTQIISSIPSINAESGTRIYSIEVPGSVTYDTRNQVNIASRVSGRIERLLVKYNYQPVKKGELIMEIYSPDLAAAQRELLYLSKSNDAEMLSRSRQRLILLGMLPAQVEKVIKTGKILYRVPVYSNTSGYILEKPASGVPAAPNTPAASTSGSRDVMTSMGGSNTSAPSNMAAITATTPVMIRQGQYISAGQSLFTIYQTKTLVADFSLPAELVSKVKKGQRLLFHDASDKRKMVTGVIALVEPTFKNGTNFTVARVYINDRGFQPGQLITAHVPVIYSSGWWLPKSAVLELGNKTIVFRKENNSYKPIAVTTGIRGNDLVQITNNIQGWDIASRAAYLVDSESFITVKEEAQ